MSGRDRPVEIGVGFWNMQGGYTFPGSGPERYRSARDEVRLAEDLGFDAVWAAEHHHCSDGYCPSPLLTLAGWATATTTVKLAVGVLVLPLHPAERVAAAATAIESLAPGRLRLAFGVGYRPVEFAAAGRRSSDRGRLLDAGLAELTTRWPAKPTGSELWIGGASTAAVRRVREVGGGLLVSETVGVEQIRTLAAELAQTPAPSAAPAARLGAVREVWVDTDRHALDDARRRLREMWRQYSFHWAPATPEGRTRRDRLVEKYAATAIIGTPDEVVSRLVTLLDAGVDTLALRARFDGADSNAVRACLELLAKDVAPAVRAR